MKSHLIKILTTTALIAVSFSTKAADTYAAISPSIPDAKIRQEVYGQLSSFALKNLKPGESLKVLNGWEPKLIATISLPSNDAYREDLKMRARAMSRSLSDLVAFIRRTGETAPGVPAYGLNVPGVCSFLAENTKASQDHSSILLVGSAVVATPEVAFQFTDGLVAADQHMRVSRTSSVFGLQGVENRLKDCNVYWITTGGGFLNDAHQSRVDRFWRLFSQVQGAKLAAFIPDPVTVMAQLVGGEVRPLVPVEMDPGDKLEMMRVQPYDLATSPLGDVMRAEVNQATVPPVTNSRVPRAVIGIRWKGDVDVDLHVQPAPSERELSYQYTASAFGSHKKDWLTQPVDAAFEMVELVPQPNGATFDLSAMRVSLNLYRGNVAVKEVTGVVRIAVENHIYEQPFRFKSPIGNGGKDAEPEKRATSGSWVVVDVARLCKIDERRARR